MAPLRVAFPSRGPLSGSLLLTLTHARWQLEVRTEVGGHEAEVAIRVLFDVVPHERAEGEHDLASIARHVERGSVQPAADPLPLIFRCDLGMKEGDGVAAHSVLGDARNPVPVVDLEPPTIRDIHDGIPGVGHRASVAAQTPVAAASRAYPPKSRGSLARSLLR